MNIYVPGKGNPNAKMVILGEGPSYEEEKHLEPFVGPSGKFLNGLLTTVGIKREECWLTNVSKYAVPPNSKTGKKIPFAIRAQSVGINVTEQIEDLRTELSQIQPNVIVALGATALWALTGIKSKPKKKETEESPFQKYGGIGDYRGSILSGMGFKVIPSWHPAHILHGEGEVKGYYNKQILIHDLRRALAQSAFKDIRRPSRLLHVIKNSSELRDWIKRAGNLIPAVDIEARNCIPVCIGLSVNPSEGITVDLWNGLSSSDLASTWVLLAEYLASMAVIGQNFGYDRDKIKRLGLLVRKLHSDTMLKSFCINPELPKNLAFNTSIYTEEPYYKDDSMYDGDEQDLFIGCARDACCTKEVDNAMDADIDSMGLRPYYEKFLLPLHDVYHFREDNTAIEQIGFMVDEKIRHDLIRKYIEWDERVRYDLFKITGEEINSGSWQQVRKLLFDKWNLPVKPSTGEESLTQLINSPSLKNQVHKRGIELILEDRRVKKTLTSYLYSPCDFDNRMRTSYFLCLETGRSATSQQEPPIRPSIKYKEGSVKKSQSRGMAFQTITKHGDIGADVRTMLVADEGHIFLQADSSQAEARVIFLLAEDYDALRLIDTCDFHALTASWFVGGTEDDWSKKKLGYEHPNRFLGKTLRHAGHLGASGRRASIETNTQARKYKTDVNITEAFAKRALETFHRKQPKIKGVFQHGIRECIEKNRRLIAPVPYGIDASVGGTRIFFERMGDELFRQAYSYLPQRTVSENTKGAARRVREREPWIKILCESHDALLTMVPIERENEAAKVLREELERPIDFASCSLERGKLIIPCEIERGFNYRDLSKFKFL